MSENISNKAQLEHKIPVFAPAGNASSSGLGSSDNCGNDKKVVVSSIHKPKYEIKSVRGLGEKVLDTIAHKRWSAPGEYNKRPKVPVVSAAVISAGGIVSYPMIIHSLTIINEQALGDAVVSSDFEFFLYCILFASMVIALCFAFWASIEASSFCKEKEKTEKDRRFELEDGTVIQEPLWDRAPVSILSKFGTHYEFYHRSKIKTFVEKKYLKSARKAGLERVTNKVGDKEHFIRECDAPKMTVFGVDDYEEALQVIEAHEIEKLEAKNRAIEEQLKQHQHGTSVSRVV